MKKSGKCGHFWLDFCLHLSTLVIFFLHFGGVSNTFFKIRII